MLAWYRIGTIDRNVTSKFNRDRNIVSWCVGHATSRRASNGTDTRKIASIVILLRVVTRRVLP